jgi:hypothetical protein
MKSLAANMRAVARAQQWRRLASTYSARELDAMSLDQWREAFKRETVDVASMDSGSISYRDSAERMRQVFLLINIANNNKKYQSQQLIFQLSSHHLPSPLTFSLLTSHLISSPLLPTHLFSPHLSSHHLSSPLTFSLLTSHLISSPLLPTHLFLSHHLSLTNTRQLLKTNILPHTDIVHKPERFFEAHRLLAYHSPILGPGFWIRFTVHYNLCVGSIVGLGSDEQIKVLEDWQREGKLGCFSLTEKYAGVNSGMIVQTVAEYNKESQCFVLNSEGEGAKKNWISQGLVADKTCVIADLRIDGASHGPHAFVMDLRRSYSDGSDVVVRGVSHGDMGRKSGL